MKFFKRIIAIVLFLTALSSYSSSMNSSPSFILLAITLGVMYISYLLWKDEDKDKERKPKAKKIFKPGRSNNKAPKDFTLIDFETTGFNFVDDEIIEIGAIKVRDLQIIDKFSTFCNPGIVINNSEFHGITNEDVETYNHFSMYIDQLLDFIGSDIIMAYNAPFDATFLNINLNKNIQNPILDLLRIARNYDKRTSYKLENIKKELDINRSSHRAINDCKTALDYYTYLLNSKEINNIIYMKYTKDLDNIRQAKKSKTCKKLLDNYKPDLSKVDQMHPFYNKKICITGNLNSMTREQVFKNILDSGGIIKNNVTLDLDYLIIGDYKTITTKQKKAIEYNKRDNVYIEPLYEKELISLLRN